MSMRRPSVLVIAYFFPPVGGVAVRRTVALVRKLRELDWLVGVATPRNRDSGPIDEAALVNGVEVIETPDFQPRSYKLRHWLLWPDEWAGWIIAARKTIKNSEFAQSASVLFATAPPYSSLLLVSLMGRALRLPYVLDFRDPWTQNLIFHRRGPRAWLSRIAERRVMGGASAIVLNTEEARIAYEQLYPEFARKLATVPNGFERLASGRVAPTEGPMRVVHSGTLAGTRVDSARVAVDAALQLENARGPGSVRLEFLGSLGDEAESMLTNHPGSHLVERPGFVTHAASLASIESADVLLLAANTEERTALHIPAKLYEYIASRRPILAITGKGGISRIIGETGAGRVVSPGDVSGCIEVLSAYLDSKRAAKLGPAGIPSVLAEYTWDAVARRLDGVLRKAAGANGP